MVNIADRVLNFIKPTFTELYLFAGEGLMGCAISLTPTPHNFGNPYLYGIIKMLPKILILGTYTGFRIAEAVGTSAVNEDLKRRKNMSTWAQENQRRYHLRAKYPKI